MIITDAVIEHSCRLIASYESRAGVPLLKARPNDELAYALYHAPFVVVSHDTAADPVFNYANRAAQELWEMTWEEFTQTPSRLSAEVMSRAEREKMLERARALGFIKDYEGIRISQSGKRFVIRQAALWNIDDHDGGYLGQAAMFHQWDFLS